MYKFRKEIFKAIHEGKWLSIEYQNKKNEITKYWIGIIDIIPDKKLLIVDGLNIGTNQQSELTIFLDSIKKAVILDNTYYPIQKRLVDDISEFPHKYVEIFQNPVNLKVLNYLSACNKMNVTPYKPEYALIEKIDEDEIRNNEYKLSEVQFESIVRKFQKKTKSKNSNIFLSHLALNVLSIKGSKGLYILAYRKLRLDVKQKRLRADDITINREFGINGEKITINKYLDESDYYLLNDFELNSEMIKDKIVAENNEIMVDDSPFFVNIGYDISVDLDKEYNYIVEMYRNGDVTWPLKAFFSECNSKPIRTKDWPITLINNKINLDQLLAIYNTLKYPVTYVQGPPGTGKTNTIVNTIVSAFFNEKTVLVTSYNNHPVDGVVSQLQNIKYRDKIVPFPILRLGNNEMIKEALNKMRELYENVAEINIYENTLDKNRESKEQQTKKLTLLLKKYTEKLDLLERKSAIEKMIEENQSNFSLTADLQAKQLHKIKSKINEIGEISEKEAISLLDRDSDEFLKYIYYTSAKHIKRLSEPKNEDLLNIINTSNEEKKIKDFCLYISNEDNLKKLIRIFPIIASTNISAYKLGEPKPYFDIVLMDEAGQCDIAVSLVPIIRGNNLMLVGDPQQLNPVIVLDKYTNEQLMKINGVSRAYNFIEKSIYQCYIENDSISEEILLSNHYRCNSKIIDFNNKKYYNNRLKIKSTNKENEPLQFIEIKDNISNIKNASLYEAEEICNFIKNNPEKSIGVITPFVNQKETINKMLESNNINVPCGTVHTFQGDEKDIILFSLALTEKTGQKTYDWLKNNKELINVATSRAKDKLVIVGSSKDIKRLHNSSDKDDDIYELCKYVAYEGNMEVTNRSAKSRALGFKPYSTETERAFFDNLNHALSIVINNADFVARKEVPISQVFSQVKNVNDLFFTGRFDFVIYQKQSDGSEYPVLAIELDGNEHKEDERVILRDRRKEQICKDNGLQLIRVDNSYARRYYYIKQTLIEYFVH